MLADIPDGLILADILAEIDADKEAEMPDGLILAE